MNVGTAASRIRESTTGKQKRAHAGNQDTPFHCLLRVRSESGQTIEAHAAMIAKEGAAVLGKIGQGVGPAFRGALNAQIERGDKTFLFLTTREGWNGPYVTYRCRLKAIYESLDGAKRALVPKYYAGDNNTIKTWFEISSIERLSRDDMNRIYVLSSSRSIMSVIASSATVFRVGVHDKENDPT